MDRDKVIPIWLVIFGFLVIILFGVLFYKLIVEILHTSIHFASWFTDTVKWMIIIVLFCTGLIIVLLVLAGIALSIKTLSQQLSTYFSDLGDKISLLLNKKPERILPLVIGVISQTFILILSKDFTTSNTKVFLSLMLYLILATISITTSRQKQKFWGGLVIIILLALTACLLLIRHQITTWKLFTDFVHMKWQTVTNRPIIDTLSISLIVFSFISLISLSLFYSFKKV